jgi:endonuclease-3
MKRILSLLRRSYGGRPWRQWGRGVDLLVETILSQNTSDANSAAGYRRLRRRFRSWNQVADAPAEEVEKCIRISGLSRIKAPRIGRVLRRVREDRGRIELEFLKEYGPAAAYEYLMRFDGVGPKTANCVLLFAFGMPVFPVDRHIHRIALRMELVPAGTSVEEAHDLLGPLIAPRERYEMHVLMIKHGRERCRARNPQCGRCALLELCPYGLRRGQADRATS